MKTAKFIENLAEKNSKIRETSKKEENLNFIPMMNSIFFEHQSNLIYHMNINEIMIM